MIAFFIDGPLDGQVDDNLASPAPEVLTMRVPDDRLGLELEPVRLSDSTPELEQVAHLYRLDRDATAPAETDAEYVYRHVGAADS